jgi:hypothetical protein
LERHHAPPHYTAHANLDSIHAALKLSLSQTQRDHVLNVMAGLMVGQGRKTLPDVGRLRVVQPDPKALADTLLACFRLIWGLHALHRQIVEFRIGLALQ